MPNESNNNSNNRTDLIDLAWMDEYDAGLKGALASIVQDYMGRLQQCVQQATGMGLSHNDLTDQLLTKLQGLQNYDDTAVRALISGIRSDLAGYYTKLETYSQAEVNQMISLIPKFGIVVIGAGESLPLTVEDQEDAGYNPEDIEVPQSDKLYLVGDANAQSPNMYTEYIYVEEDDDYEMLGTQRLDLSGYSTTAQMNQAIANAIASMPTMSDTAITSSTIGQKQFFVGEKVNGKYVLQPFSPADLKQMVYDYMASNNVASAFASVLGVVQSTCSANIPLSSVHYYYPAVRMPLLVIAVASDNSYQAALIYKFKETSGGIHNLVLWEVHSESTFLELDDNYGRVVQRANSGDARTYSITLINLPWSV